MEGVKVQINKYAAQIEDVSKDLEITVPKSPNLTKHICPLVNGLMKKLEEVRKLHQVRVEQLKQGALVENFRLMLEELRNKIKQVVSPSLKFRNFQLSFEMMKTLTDFNRIFSNP